MIAEANAGFENSKIDMKLELLCMEELDIEELSDHIDMLNSFRVAKGSAEKLLNSADLAFLLVKETNAFNCGVAFFRTNIWPFGMNYFNCFCLALSIFQFRYGKT